MKAMKKLIPAVAMLLVSVVTMSTASFAWFSMSRQVTANGMNVTVTTPTNLEIKATTDGTYASSASINYVDAANGLASQKLVPASTKDGKNFYIVNTADKTAGEVETDGTLSENVVLMEGTEANGAYIDFEYTIHNLGDEKVDVVIKSVEVNAANSSDKSLKPVRVAVIYNNNVVAMFKPVTGAANTDNKVVSGINDSTKLPTMAADTGIYANHAPANQGQASTVVQQLATNEANITIRVWYEGQDTECTTAMGANAQFNVEVVLAVKDELPASGS